MENGQPKTQSVQAYPTYGLEDCLKVGRAVKELGGGKEPISKSLLASHLREAASSSRLVQLIASAKSFGIVTGRGDYTLSDPAKKYYTPHNEQDAAIGLLAFVQSPVPFQKLIKRFDGDKLPGLKFIANILQSEGDVPKSWSARAASLFVQAAKFAGAIDSNGFLRYEAAIHGASLDAAADELYKEGLDARDKLRKENPPDAVEPPPSDCNVWDFSLGGKTVHLETSKDLPLPLWEKLEQYIKVIKPPEES